MWVLRFVICDLSRVPEKESEGKFDMEGEELHAHVTRCPIHAFMQNTADDNHSSSIFHFLVTLQE